MITFPCVCKNYVFELPQELAGSEIQCPECGRLNDVPTLSDLSSIDDDGTLRLTDTPSRRTDDPATLRELLHVYAKEKFDEDGNPIDLRQTPDEMGGSAASEQTDERDEIPLASQAHTPIGLAPRYDPETGELLTPLDIKPEPPKRVLPFNQPPLAAMPVAPGVQPVGPGATARDQQLANEKRTLAYARKGVPNPANVRAAPTLSQIPIRLLEPENLVAQFFMGLALIFALFVTVMVLSLPLFIVAMPLCWAAVIAHFANCIEDLGPGEADELPRFMRDFAIWSDVWMPFVRMVFSLGVAFMPGLMFLVTTINKLPDPVRYAGAGAMGLIGFLFFPALALIFCASGHLGNLRPDRIIGTVATMGMSYFLLVILAGLAIVSIGGAIVFFDLLMASLFTTSMMAAPVALGFFLIAVVVAVYVGHCAAWSLGATYRRHADQFPWVFEEHERVRAEEKRLRALAKIEHARARRTITTQAGMQR